MPRITITLSEERMRAVRETAARRRITITRLIEESLELAGVFASESARQIVARGRASARMTDADAMALALRETAAERKQRQ